ncbi:MAG: Uncharacterised protein [Opitutia bacterium UBA7350]|nr:MAG: Uncharacterised protein [Opitutae bacterium UBA7350]
MSHQIYQILHILGILMVFLGYGALLGRALAGSDSPSLKKLGSITSGIGLVLILVAGFGLIAKLGYGYGEAWILIKLGVWVALGGLIVAINRKPCCASKIWWVLLALGAIAAAAVYWFRFL